MELRDHTMRSSGRKAGKATTIMAVASSTTATITRQTYQRLSPGGREYICGRSGNIPVSVVRVSLVTDRIKRDVLTTRVAMPKKKIHISPILSPRCKFRNRNSSGNGNRKTVSGINM